MVLSPNFSVFSKLDENGKTIYMVAQFRYVEFNEVNSDFRENLDWYWIDRNLHKAVGRKQAKEMRESGYRRVETRVTPDGNVQVIDLYI